MDLHAVLVVVWFQASRVRRSAPAAVSIRLNLRMEIKEVLLSSMLCQGVLWRSLSQPMRSAGLTS